jgi:hypothetical protein
LKRTFRVFFFIFLLPYLCLHIVGLVRMEVVWVCFDVLFFISEFYFLFLLIFILFSLEMYIHVFKIILCSLNRCKLHFDICKQHPLRLDLHSSHMGGLGGSMSYVVGSNNSYKPITKTFRQNIAEILLKVALNTKIHSFFSCAKRFMCFRYSA